MNVEHQQFEELLESYTLDLLDLEERVFFEQHLYTCADCLKNWQSYKQALAKLAFEAPPVEPRATLKDDVLSGLGMYEGDNPFPSLASESVASEPVSLPISPEMRKQDDALFRRIPLFAALAFGLIAMVWATSIQGERTRLWQDMTSANATATSLGQRVNVLSGQVNNLQQENTALKVDGGLNGKAINFIAAAAILDIKATPAGSENSSEPSARVFYRPEGKDVYVMVANLPPPPDSKVYQLWLNQGDLYLPVQSFTTSSDGTAMFHFQAPEDLTRYQKTVISIESDSHSQYPSGEIVLDGPR
ncbi:MAG: anti-sigma factor [Chloroflexi bacterium]|nr:anti-sigma factor [Chloroflexota bacterium]